MEENDFIIKKNVSSVLTKEMILLFEKRFPCFKLLKYNIILILNFLNK